MLGVVLALLTALLFGLSGLGQKAALPSAQRFRYRDLARNKRWLASVALGCLGALSYLAALSLAPLSSVMPILSASFVVPVVGGAALLKERVSKRQWLCVVVLVAGVALVTVS